MPWRGYVGPVDAKGQDGEDEINIARLIAETIKRGLEWVTGGRDAGPILGYQRLSSDVGGLNTSRKVCASTPFGLLLGNERVTQTLHSDIRCIV